MSYADDTNDQEQTAQGEDLSGSSEFSDWVLENYGQNYIEMSNADASKAIDAWHRRLKSPKVTKHQLVSPGVSVIEGSLNLHEYLAKTTNDFDVVETEGITFEDEEIEAMQKDPAVLRALADWHSCKFTEEAAIGDSNESSLHDARCTELRQVATAIEESY